MSQQISGWGSYYLDYKFLKKIINSLEKGRLADAALFATSVRPEETSDGPQPLLPIDSPGSELQVHKAAFFFRLERELEKINAFYLQKESELRTRLTTLITKKRHLIALATRAPGQAHKGMRLTPDTPSLVTLLEGFRYFEKDLSKLQQFIEINATGFRKILKKWDKRFKSQTKELYLARQVEVQPCFNREFMTEMSDIASASILQLESLAHGQELPATQFKSETALLRGAAPYASTNLPGSLIMAEDDRVENQFASERPLEFDAERLTDTRSNHAIAELENQVASALHEMRIDDAKRALEQIRQQTTENLEQSLGGAHVNEHDDIEAPVRASISHLVWRALVSSTKDVVRAAIEAGLPDYTFVDDVNARTALHISAYAGQLELCEACVQHGVEPRASDVYGREALAYAAICGLEQICTFLLSLPAVRAAPDCVVNCVDLDGFSPLTHAIVRGHTGTVKVLLDYAKSVGAQIQAKTENSDLSPLAIAAQCGLVDITRLLLEHGAKVEMNTEGLLPQTLAARAGHTECLRLLIDAHVDVNAVEKGTLCTPLFYAAEFGHAACVEMLLAAGANVNHVDEKGRHAVFYAAWHGWRECTRMLLAAHAKSGPEAQANGAGSLKAPQAVPTIDSSAPMETDIDADLEGDGIPSLHLPPPIIPFRTYGHNYLDKRWLLCLSVSNHSIVLHKQAASDRPDMVPGLTPSFKLVLTPRSTSAGDQAGIPHTMIFPIADEREEVSFQVADMEHFYLECEIYPTFGSARMAKTVLPPQALSNLQNRTHMSLPLFDWHTNLMGHMDVVLECVRPYGSVQLQIGGHVETYWKSTLPSQNQPLTVSPLPHPTGHDAQDTGLYVTASSLSGNYLRVPVQFTKDLVPIACAFDRLPLHVWAPRVSQVTLSELNHIAECTNHTWHVSEDDVALDMAAWSARLDEALVPLETLLETLPQTVGVALEIQLEKHAPPPLNACIDATLQVVYDVARREKHRRRLFFSSAVPSACVALNWKQPNYAVFFINNATLDADANVSTLPKNADPRQSSVAEAVRFAKGNNLLGVMLDTSLLESVPEILNAVKAAGLVLITLSQPSMQSDWSAFNEPKLLGVPALACPDAIDGFLENNVVKCT